MEKRAELKAKVTDWSEEGTAVTCDVDFKNINYCDLVSMFSSIAIHIAGYTDKSARNFLKDVYKVIVNLERDGLIKADKESGAGLKLIDKQDILKEIETLENERCVDCTDIDCTYCFEELLKHIPEINS